MRADKIPAECEAIGVNLEDITIDEQEGWKRTDVCKDSELPLQVLIDSLDLLLNEWAINNMDYYWKKHPDDKETIEEAKVLYKQLTKIIGG